MLERLNVFLGGCGGKGAKTATALKRSIRVEMRWKRKALSRWSFVCLVMCLPKSPKKFNPCLVERCHGLNCDPHKQVGLAEYAAFPASQEVVKSKPNLTPSPNPTQHTM